MKYQIVTFQTSSFEEETGILVELVETDTQYYARVLTEDKEILRGSPDQIEYVGETIEIDDLNAFRTCNDWVLEISTIDNQYCARILN